MSDGRKLVLRWGRASRWDEPDWVYDYPDYKWNARLLHALVCGNVSFPNFLDELEQRGYDTKTLRLSVRRKPSIQIDNTAQTGTAALEEGGKSK